MSYLLSYMVDRRIWPRILAIITSVLNYTKGYDQSQIKFSFLQQEKCLQNIIVHLKGLLNELLKDSNEMV